MWVILVHTQFLCIMCITQSPAPLFSPSPYPLSIFCALPPSCTACYTVSVALPPAVEGYPSRKAISRVLQGVHIITCFVRVFSFRVNICLCWALKFQNLSVCLGRISIFLILLLCCFIIERFNP